MKTRILLYGLFLNCYLLHGQPNNNPSTIEYLGSNDLPPAFWSVIDSEQEVNNQPERPVDRTVTYLETFDDPLSDWVDGGYIRTQIYRTSIIQKEPAIMIIGETRSMVSGSPMIRIAEV